MDQEWEIERETALVVLPSQLRIPLPCPELPEAVLNSITAVQVQPGLRPAGMQWACMIMHALSTCMHDY